MSVRSCIPSLVTIMCLLPIDALSAVTKIENLCTVGGGTEMTLRGQGLVVGLNGTGDTDGNAVTVRAVTSYLQKSGQQATPAELKKLGQYAVVEITATVPRSGIARGQKLDCTVSGLGGVNSLEGGQLVLAGLALPGDRDNSGDLLVSAAASGRIIVENPLTPTTGRIPGGVVMARTLSTHSMRNPTQVELLIDRPYASYRMANTIQRAINATFSLQGEIAKAHSEVLILVQIPEPYRADYVQFLSELMSVSVLEAGSYPRVVINASQGIVAATSAASISPATFTHRNINVEIGDPFVAVQSDNGSGSPQQLNDLIDAMNQLKVPTEDIIAIVRELHALGALQAKLIER